MLALDSHEQLDRQFRDSWARYDWAKSHSRAHYPRRTSFRTRAKSASTSAPLRPPVRLCAPMHNTSSEPADKADQAPQPPANAGGSNPSVSLSMLEMAGCPPPGLPSAHLDPAAFAAPQSPPPNSSGQVPRSDVSRASQGVPLPESIIASDHNSVRPAQGDRSDGPAENARRPSLFSTATAATPIPFSSHPALQGHAPPFRYDAGGGVNPGAGFLGDGWHTGHRRVSHAPPAVEPPQIPPDIDLSPLFGMTFPDASQPSGLMGYGSSSEPSINGTSSGDPTRNNSLASVPETSLRPEDLHVRLPLPPTADVSQNASLSTAPPDNSWANGYLPLPILASLIATSNPDDAASTISSGSGQTVRPGLSGNALTESDSNHSGSGGSRAPKARTDSGTSGNGSNSGSGQQSAFGGPAWPPRQGSSRSGSGGNGDEDEGAGSGKRKRDKEPSEGKKIVQRADKSCKKCRERRVRCDRLWPACERCHKRRERCDWADGTNVDEVEEGGDAERINALQSKVAYLERQLKMAQNVRRDSDSQPRSGPGSAPANHIELSPPDSVRQNGALPLESRDGRNYASPGQEGNMAMAIWATIRDIWALRMNLEPEETDNLLKFLAVHTTAPYASQLELGRENVHWRLAEPHMAKKLTIHLLDAAVRACCSRLPGIQPLAKRIEYYKHNLEALTPAEECSVAVLAALGARASPHSQLLGVDTLCLANGTPSPPLFLYAGERREMACRQLESRARELCWSHGFFEHARIEHLDSTVGLVQLLIYEEILPKTSRFFTRSALGLYFDLRYSDLEKGVRTSEDPRIGPGAALFLADATIAAACGRPSYIATSDLDQYVITDGVRIPDFPGSELQTELEGILQRPITTQKLTDAMATVMLWVAGCHRLFAQLSTARRPQAASTLPLLKSLWKLVDKVHTAVQNMQQFLVSLAVEDVIDLENDPFALEHYILMGVRYDSLLVDVVNLQHSYLLQSRKTGAWAEREDDPVLLEMREESMLRVRKCFKLTAFYAHLYLQSQDKHLVHHMLMQVEMLPNWSIWATQRLGTPGGPIAPEYEVTETELDWLQQALELSSYYTPRAAHRLEAFVKARGQIINEGPGSIEELMRRSGEALKGPVAELQAQYQQTMPEQAAQNSQQEPDGLSQIPPTLHHVPLHEDPQRFYNVDSGSYVPSASEIFVFDEYGVAALHGVPLSQHQPVNSLDFVHNGFQTRDQSWMNLPADYPMAIGQEPAQESQPAESALDGWLGEEGTSSRKQG
ncbi:hypothetical protein JCM8202_002490 [Rhodotorula sphaerocarpa]